MKKVLSMVLTITMLFGLLSIFTYAVEEDTPYSGGSGTEEDPYLLSTTEDIKELAYNIENDPSIYNKRLHYKMINDIIVTSPISPCFINEFTEPNCFVETDYTIYSFPMEYNYETGIYTDLSADGKNFDDIVSIMGPLYIQADHEFEEDWTGIYRTCKYVYTAYTFSEFDSFAKVYSYGGFEPEGSYLEGYRTFYRKRFYRSASFTGILDGNGYTMIMDFPGLLFGFVENGAEIRNLNINADVGLFAYDIDDSCIIKNCSFNIHKSASISYASNHLYEHDLDHDTYEYKIVYTTIADFATNSNGLFIDCISYGNCGFVEYCQKSKYDEKKYLNASRCVNLNVDADQQSTLSEYYTLEECKAAGGDPSAYKDFDFENVWMMVDGMPYLRTFFKADAADVNYDGKVNAADSLLLKMHIAGALQENAFTFFKAADLDKNQTLNAADSLLVKRHIAGN